jgi:hypothetical protein
MPVAFDPSAGAPTTSVDPSDESAIDAPNQSATSEFDAFT